MNDRNRDDFYEGPPLEDSQRWHDGAVVETDRAAAPEGADHASGSLVDVEVPDAGAYPPPEVVERPHQPADGIPGAELTSDPSLSRAVDRAPE